MTPDFGSDGGWLPGGDRTDSERSSSVAGQFYAGRESTLRQQLRECFEHDLGPGPIEAADEDLDRDSSDAIDEDHRATDPVLVVSPHAGYPFSGPVAAHGMAALASSDPTETLVIFGPNHRRVGEPAAVAPHERWETPLGSVPVDEEMASEIVDRSDVATFDARGHEGEHSIEVQVPFLQYCLEAVSIVPICLALSELEAAKGLGRDIVASIEALDRDAAIVASTDLTHYEDHETAVAADEPILEAIERLDVDAIAERVETGHTMCGPWSTVAGLSAARELEREEGRVLQYATSGDTEGDRNRVVGYCSAIV